jgi:hypothetical protein
LNVICKHWSRPEGDGKSHAAIMGSASQQDHPSAQVPNATRPGLE